jgi:hypothetical protein
MNIREARLHNGPARYYLIYLYIKNLISFSESWIYCVDLCIAAIYKHLDFDDKLMYELANITKLSPLPIESDSCLLCKCAPRTFNEMQLQSYLLQGDNSGFCMASDQC